jgi:hypothetical protein
VSERDRKSASNRFNAGNIRGSDRRRIDFIRICEQDDHRGARKQLQPALNDSIEDRLSIGEGVTDDAEYSGGRGLLL